MSVHPDRVAFARDARLELWDASGAREATLDLSATHDLVSSLAFDPTEPRSREATPVSYSPRRPPAKTTRKYLGL